MLSAKLVNVPANGACFYHGVYGSLKAQNLLDRVCSIFGFPKTEKAFIQAVKQFILRDNFNEYKRQYAEFFDAICSKIQRRNTDFHDIHMTPAEYDNMLKIFIDPLPKSLMELLLKHIKNRK